MCHSFMVCLWICVGSILRQFLPHVLRFLPTCRNSAKSAIFSRKKRHDHWKVLQSLDCGTLHNGALSGCAAHTEGYARRTIHRANQCRGGVFVAFFLTYMYVYHIVTNSRCCIGSLLFFPLQPFFPPRDNS